MSPPTIAALVLLAMLATIGAALIDWALRTGRLARRAATWPVATARVTRSERGKDAEGDAIPCIEVRYRIGGRELVTHAPWFGTTPTGEAVTTVMLRRFPLGRTVALHYDPVKPTRATLLPARRAGTTLAAAIGATFVLVSGGAAWLIWP